MSDKITVTILPPKDAGRTFISGGKPVTGVYKCTVSQAQKLFKMGLIASIPTTAEDAKTFASVAGKHAETLTAAGIATLEQLAEADAKTLEDLNGIGAKTATALIAAAKEAVGA